MELPLALPMMLAGIKIAAVVNVGTATIAAFVGAGGFGTRIVQGLALNDTTLLLAGALWWFDRWQARRGTRPETRLTPRRGRSPASGCWSSATPSWGLAPAWCCPTSAPTW